MENWCSTDAEDTTTSAPSDATLYPTGNRRQHLTRKPHELNQVPALLHARILFQKSSERKKCFFDAGTIAQCLVPSPKSENLLSIPQKLSSAIRLPASPSCLNSRPPFVYNQEHIATGKKLLSLDTL